MFRAIYLLFLLLALSLGVVVYGRLRRRGILLALGGSLLSLVIFSLFLPIPIHSGFTSPLEIAWETLQSERWHHKARLQEEKRHEFEQVLQKRFSGTLEDYTNENETDGWYRVRLATGQVAWLDRESHLLWLPPQSVASDESLLSLETAIRFCQKQAPQGFWSIPSEAELALLWHHRGHRLMPGSGQSSVALLAEPSLGVQMATHFRGRGAGHALRCVALGPSAPRRGYLASDIPQPLWNNYQLHKGELYTTSTPGEPRVDQEIK